MARPTIRPLPRPEERRVIIALNEAEYGRCSYDDAGKRLLASVDTWVVPLPVPDIFRRSQVITRLIDSGLLTDGRVLLQSPYSFDDYEPAENYAERVAVKKHFIFSELCRRLGASRVKVTTVATASQEGTTSVDVSATRSGTKGEVHVEKGRLASFATQLTLDDEFDLPTTDIAGANALLAENHLESEPVLASLVLARSRDGTQLRNRSFTLEVTRETNDRLQALGRLGVPMFIKLTADCNRLVKEVESYRVTYEVTFSVRE